MNDKLHFTKHCNPTLKAQAEKILPALNAFLYAWVVVDAQARIVGANDDYLALIGKDFDAIANKPMGEIVAQTHLPTVVRSGEPEYLYDLTYDGNKRCIASSIPLRDEEANTVIGAAGIVAYEDITQLLPLLDGIAKQRSQEERKWRATYRFENIKGSSKKLQEATDLAKRAAKRDCAILITGETGTGKELFAHAIHNESNREGAPFVPLNMAGIPRERLEEEIFGTFAETKLAQFSGKLKFARDGTLFLDEVGALPVPAQYLLLRVLEEKSVAKIGGNQKAAVDVRIIASTNRELWPMVEDGGFLKELYFRLHGVTINLPPLRECSEDLPPLCGYLLRDIARGRSVDGDALRVLRDYSWPGNVRELRNVLEQVCVYYDKLKLTATEFESVLPSG